MQNVVHVNLDTVVDMHNAHDMPGCPFETASIGTQTQLSQQSCLQSVHMTVYDRVQDKNQVVLTLTVL